MAEKRGDILKAARPIFLRDGLDGTTLDRVAAEGGISKMTLYRHFSSKEALFEALVTDMCEDMRQSLENAPFADSNQSAGQQLAEEMRTFIQGLTEPSWLSLYRLIVADGWRFPDLAHVFDLSGMRVIRRRIATLLEAGGLPATRSARVASEVVALALGDAYQRAILGIAQAGDGDAFEQQIESAVMHGFSGTSKDRS